MAWVKKGLVFDPVPPGARENWEREMHCSPYVIDVEGGRCMFCNGFGRSGFGIAKLRA